MFSRVKRTLHNWWELSSESLILITQEPSKDTLGDKISDSLVSLTSGLIDFFSPRDSLNVLSKNRFCRPKMQLLPEVEHSFEDALEIRFGPVR